MSLRSLIEVVREEVRFVSMVLRSEVWVRMISYQPVLLTPGDPVPTLYSRYFAIHSLLHWHDIFHWCNLSLQLKISILLYIWQEILFNMYFNMEVLIYEHSRRYKVIRLSPWLFIKPLYISITVLSIVQCAGDIAVNKTKFSLVMELTFYWEEGIHKEDKEKINSVK